MRVVKVIFQSVGYTLGHENKSIMESHAYEALDEYMRYIRPLIWQFAPYILQNVYLSNSADSILIASS